MIQKNNQVDLCSFSTREKFCRFFFLTGQTLKTKPRRKTNDKYVHHHYTSLQQCFITCCFIMKNQRKHNQQIHKTKRKATKTQPHVQITLFHLFVYYCFVVFLHKLHFIIFLLLLLFTVVVVDKLDRPLKVHTQFTLKAYIISDCMQTSLFSLLHRSPG